MSDSVYSRAPGVVWRLGPDRVLVRRIDGLGDDAAAELFGAAALVWVAIDEPGTIGAVIHRMPDHGLEVGKPDLELLLGRGWLVSSQGDCQKPNR